MRRRHARKRAHAHLELRSLHDGFAGRDVMAQAAEGSPVGHLGSGPRAVAQRGREGHAESCRHLARAILTTKSFGNELREPCMHAHELQWAHLDSENSSPNPGVRGERRGTVRDDCYHTN